MEGRGWDNQMERATFLLTRDLWISQVDYERESHRQSPPRATTDITTTADEYEMEDVDDNMDDEFHVRDIGSDSNVDEYDYMSGEGSEKACKITNKTSLYYDFRRNSRSVKSTILHFQVKLVVFGAVLSGFQCTNKFYLIGWRDEGTSSERKIG
ncbi:hypothetical protein L6452_43494 [Arctium lappa]|uniref:Uncharacterized protein n=1 Tax=Arctium lappa TaxID=4217 RepID=A0ACB8XDS2_ARCLA|nr:hypothetical protein L6452_43494 [Arctium lappa]